ncbi:uncharacterized protein J3D65DRAFT_313659 [Phyllosticta citribraziliensis]|uniref:Uncharacterized protein n=1 Tax=Phyllosticta citribraziliensis TaxID=989973 RepID=A0ABR1LTP8_9PEZI
MEQTSRRCQPVHVGRFVVFFVRPSICVYPHSLTPCHTSCAFPCHFIFSLACASCSTLTRSSPQAIILDRNDHDGPPPPPPPYVFAAAARTRAPSRRTAAPHRARQRSRHRKYCPNFSARPRMPKGDSGVLPQPSHAHTATPTPGTPQEVRSTSGPLGARTGASQTSIADLTCPRPRSICTRGTQRRRRARPRSALTISTPARSPCGLPHAASAPAVLDRQACLCRIVPLLFLIHEWISGPPELSNGALPKHAEHIQPKKIGSKHNTAPQLSPLSVKLPKVTSASEDAMWRRAGATRSRCRGQQDKWTRTQQIRSRPHSTHRASSSDRQRRLSPETRGFRAGASAKCSRRCCSRRRRKWTARGRRQTGI